MAVLFNKTSSGWRSQSKGTFLKSSEGEFGVGEFGVGRGAPDGDNPLVPAAKLQGFAAIAQANGAADQDLSLFFGSSAMPFATNV
jgi:hypothetical protein